MQQSNHDNLVSLHSTVTSKASRYYSCLLLSQNASFIFLFILNIERLRILDSRTIPASFQGSIDFNMQPVINYWQNMPDSNYGMLVKVEDKQGNSLQPKMYLQQMNCSGKKY